MNISGAGLQTLIAQLREKRALFVFPADYNGPTIESMVHVLAKRAAARVNITTIAAIIAALDWCISVGAPELTVDVAERLSSPPQANEQYISTVLVPLLPVLQKWSVKNHRNMNVAIRNILVTWTEMVLGPFPAAGSTLAAQLNNLKWWTCPCRHCQNARIFLTKKDGRTTRLLSIGAASRKHLEGHLDKHARNLATWDLIHTTPQGLTVRGHWPMIHIMQQS